MELDSYNNPENIEEVLISKPELSPKSIDTYTAQYDKLSMYLISPISSASQARIIKTIEQAFPNPNTTQAYLNVAIIVRKFYKVKTTELCAFRERNKDKIDAHRLSTNIQLDKELPTFKELLQYLDHLDAVGHSQAYVINYLLIFLNVRNDDLDLIIVDSLKDATEPDENYLVMRNKEIVYIRRRYKTAKKYGQKINRINHKTFTSHLNKFINKNHFSQLHLLQTPIGDRVSRDGVGSYVATRTMDKIGEGSYCKIIMRDINKKRSPSRLKRLSKNRGTDIQTLITSYNMDSFF